METVNNVTSEVIGAAIEVHRELLSYLRLSGLTVGLLIDFNVEKLE